MTRKTEIGDTGDLLHDVLDFAGSSLELVEIIAKELERVFAFHTRHGFFDVVLNVLREAEIDAWVFRKLLRHLLDEIVFGDATGPLVLRLQLNEELGIVKGDDVGAVIGAANL